MRLAFNIFNEVAAKLGYAGQIPVISTINELLFSRKRIALDIFQSIKNAIRSKYLIGQFEFLVAVDDID